MGRLGLSRTPIRSPGQALADPSLGCVGRGLEQSAASRPSHQGFSGMTPVTLPPSGLAAWDDLATWWLSRYKLSTQLTYATYLPPVEQVVRWPPDRFRWQHGARMWSYGYAPLPTPGCLGPRSPRTTTPWPASTAWPMKRSSSWQPLRPRRPAENSAGAAAPGGAHCLGVRRFPDDRPSAGPDPPRHRRAWRDDGPPRHGDGHPGCGVLRHRAWIRHPHRRRQGRQARPRPGAHPCPRRRPGRHRRPHRRAPPAYPKWCRHGAPNRAPICRRDRQGGGHHPAHWAPRAAPHLGTVGLNQGIPLRDVQRLLRHARPETTLGSYDITGEALERHASHQVAGFLAGWAG
jgi:hypothetical protein